MQASDAPQDVWIAPRLLAAGSRPPPAPRTPGHHCPSSMLVPLPPPPSGCHCPHYSLDRFSSSLASVARCTSSGPSAMRRVRACVHSRASIVSWLTPAPPCACSQGGGGGREGGREEGREGVRASTAAEPAICPASPLHRHTPAWEPGGEEGLACPGVTKAARAHDTAPS